MTRTVTLLRLEGLALLATAVTLYAVLGGSWWLFLLLLFAPDLFMLGYLRGPKVGAAVYNVGHVTLTPIVIGLVSYFVGAQLGVQIAVIWLAHIGMDRLAGYGLKEPTGFQDTHMGRIGRS